MKSFFGIPEGDISTFRRWSYERFQDDNNIFHKMKNDLNTRTWQDVIWCHINIILFCTSDNGPTRTLVIQHDHFTRGSLFELTDAAFSGLLPWGVGFSHSSSRVAVSLLEFASELSLSLFFGVISDHGWGHTIVLEDKGQGLMCLPFALHRMGTWLPKGSGVCLGHCIALLWHQPSKHCVAKHGIVLGRLATSSRCTSKVRPAIDVQARSKLVKWRLQVLGCC
jgi:hypothetical protein